MPHRPVLLDKLLGVTGPTTSSQEDVPIDDDAVTVSSNNLQSHSSPTRNTDTMAAASCSPRSSESVETSHSPKLPSSPFLHNLHHRFRKGSTASSSVSSEAATPPEPVDKVEATLSAKRFLLATIRNDWEWPLPSDVPKSQPCEEIQKNELLATREPLSWTPRLDGQSDIDLDSDGSNAGKKRRRKSSNPYKYENPDAVASALLERKLKRKRKVEAEMECNEGLRLWSERRDAWTGAVRTIPKPPTGDSVTAQLGGNAASARASSSVSLGRSSARSQHTQSSKDSLGKVSENSTSEQVEDVASQPATWPLPAEDDPQAPYVPIYPPLFPTSHALRAGIRPPAYPTIYSKVVLQSLTPNIPIPLNHMISALVDGWKSEGNWPPEAAVAEAAETLKQRRRGRGEGAFAKWRREQDERRRLKRLSAEVNVGAGYVDGGPDEVELSEKKGLRKHIAGAVKKVFGKNDAEHDADGGLERMGVKFLDGSLSDEVEANGVSGLMEEAKEIQAENVVLNRGLIEGTPA